MTGLVIDASVAVRWLIADGAAIETCALREQAHLIAPDLLAMHGAHLLWKKVRRGELSTPAALMAARRLQVPDVELGIELLPGHALTGMAMRLALDLEHSPSHCLYLALAVARGYRLLTEDVQLLRKLARGNRDEWLRVAFSPRELALAMRA